jgi:CPA2 family monovalent cation:H+ antiporter-2
MAPWELLLEIMTLLAAALVLGALARRLGQRPVIGYLAAGLSLGPNALGLIRSVDSVMFLAELGAALLLFTIGLEFSPAAMRQLGARPLVAGVLQVALTFAAGFAGALAFGLGTAGSYAIGAAVALSSTAVVLRILGDRTELESRAGRVTTAILLLQDLLLVPLLLGVSLLGQGKSGWEGLAAMGWSIAKAAGLVAGFRLVLQTAGTALYRAVPGSAERDFPALLAVVACAGCAWTAHWAGLSAVLGAFAGGLVLADLPAAHQLRADVIPLRSVFVTLFFASIGMLATFQPNAGLGKVFLLALALVAGKALLGTVAVAMSGESRGSAIRAGFALAQIGEFSFVIAQEARRWEVLPDWAAEPLLGASVLSLVATPYLIAASPKIAKWLTRTSPGGAESDRGAARADAIVVGAGPAGAEVVRQLALLGLRVNLIDLNPEGQSAIAGSGRFYPGDAASVDVLSEAGAGSVSILVVTVPDPRIACQVIRGAKLLSPDLHVIARSRYNRYRDLLLEAGADAIVDEEALVGQRLAAEANQWFESSRTDAQGATLGESHSGGKR